MSTLPFRKFPPPRREMTLQEHKDQQDDIRGDHAGNYGYSVLHELFVAAYPHKRQQNN